MWQAMPTWQVEQSSLPDAHPVSNNQTPLRKMLRQTYATGIDWGSGVPSWQQHGESNVLVYILGNSFMTTTDFSVL